MTALVALRRLLPLRIGTLLDSARASVAVLHYSVVSRAAVEQAHARGAAVLAWTVDQVPALERVLAAGVDGVITNDPRLLSHYTPSP
jgi:glycerophosphoryl diester phosphodiesterase